jgi:hypothetical protein
MWLPQDHLGVDMRILMLMLSLLSANVWADTLLNIKPGPRLDAVVSQVTSMKLGGEPIDWRASYLRVSDASVVGRKQAVLTALSAIDSVEAKSLKAYIEALPDMRRLDYSLDIDQVRLSLANNPQLDKQVLLVVKHQVGQYKLLRGGQLQAATFKPLMAVSQIVAKADHSDFVYLIGVQGGVRKIGVRAFNAEQAYLSANDFVYLPLHSLSEELNKRVVSLIAEVGV